MSGRASILKTLNFFFFFIIFYVNSFIAVMKIVQFYSAVESRDILK